jgi:hypothetical protein
MGLSFEQQSTALGEIGSYSINTGGSMDYAAAAAAQTAQQQQQQRSSLSTIKEESGGLTENDRSFVRNINACRSAYSTRSSRQQAAAASNQPPPLAQGISKFDASRQPFLYGNNSLADHNYALRMSISASSTTRYRSSNFISGDPNSDRLAEFVSKMVYVIFWSGSDSYLALFQQQIQQLNSSATSNHQTAAVASSSAAAHYHQYNHRVGGSSGGQEFHAPAEFIRYTKYLLETMQISCSTALLSLFYLHRLRPRVKHLFVPGK